VRRSTSATSYSCCCCRHASPSASSRTPPRYSALPDPAVGLRSPRGLRRAPRQWRCPAWLQRSASYGDFMFSFTSRSSRPCCARVIRCLLIGHVSLAWLPVSSDWIRVLHDWTANVLACWALNFPAWSRSTGHPAGRSLYVYIILSCTALGHRFARCHRDGYRTMTLV